MKASDLFGSIVTTGSEPLVKCEFCGRLYHAALSNSVSKEVQNLHPIEKLVGGIAYGYFAGKKAVIDCACGSLAQYESFIYTHRNIICRYLLERAREEVASSDLAKVNAEAARKVTQKISDALDDAKSLIESAERKPRRITTE